jgi:hypothetical protein
MEKRVLYKKKDEKGPLQRLFIDNDQEPGHKIAQKIRFKECIENKLHIAMYYNKTGETIRDSDMINADTIIDYETIPLSQVPLLFPTGLASASNQTGTKKAMDHSMAPPS